MSDENTKNAFSLFLPVFIFLDYAYFQPKGGRLVGYPENVYAGKSEFSSPWSTGR